MQTSFLFVIPLHFIWHSFILFAKTPLLKIKTPYVHLEFEKRKKYVSIKTNYPAKRKRLKHKYLIK